MEVICLAEGEGVKPPRKPKTGREFLIHEMVGEIPREDPKKIAIIQVERNCSNQVWNLT